MLLIVVIYIILLFSKHQNAYQSLDNQIMIGTVLAVDSSGLTITFPIYNSKDSTVSIIVSSDSGNSFKVEGGPWKNIYNDNFDRINSIAIAPDNKSIIAVGEQYIYLKGFDKDSFSCISLKNFPGFSLFERMSNFCFIPETDSVFIYSQSASIISLNYKNYDSIAIGSLKNIFWLRSMYVDKKKQIFALGERYDYAGGNSKLGLLFNNIFVSKTYAVAEYNNKEANKILDTSGKNSTKNYMDTVSKR